MVNTIWNVYLAQRRCDRWLKTKFDLTLRPRSNMTSPLDSSYRISYLFILNFYMQCPWSLSPCFGIEFMETGLCGYDARRERVQLKEGAEKMVALLEMRPALRGGGGIVSWNIGGPYIWNAYLTHISCYRWYKLNPMYFNVKGPSPLRRTCNLWWSLAL